MFVKDNVEKIRANEDASAMPEMQIEPEQNLKIPSEFTKNKMQSEKRKKFFVPYPRTCGFAWSCHGNMVFFANEKYNFKVLEKQPELKKVTEWPNPNAPLLSGGEVAEQEGETGLDFVRLEETGQRKKNGQTLVNVGKELRH